MSLEQCLAQARTQYDLGSQLDCSPFGNGHINETFCLSCEKGGVRTRYILQRMNRSVFKHTDQLMSNVIGVTTFLKRKIAQDGGDPLRQTLDVIQTRDGKGYYLDEEGNGWRLYRFIEDTFSLDAVRTPEDFYESALAFGRFQRMLADYPAETLYETIPDFHNTRVRYARFEEVVKADICGRLKEARSEAQFVLQRKELAGSLVRMKEDGLLPLRVTHNDTKLNNILMDAKTGKGLCIIDLDTVMPGLSAYDFGDAIRFGASTAAEDETDLNRVSCDMDLFALYVKGFVEGCDGALTQEEILALPLGAMVITYENGLRFLADYLEGDVYFKIHRPGHNLDRARTQLKLVADMESKKDIMQEIVRKQL